MDGERFRFDERGATDETATILMASILFLACAPSSMDGLRPSSKRVLLPVVFRQSARVPMNEVVALFSVVDSGEENGKARVTQDHAHLKVFPIIDSNMF